MKACGNCKYYAKRKGMYCGECTYEISVKLPRWLMCTDRIVLPDMEYCDTWAKKEKKA